MTTGRWDRVTPKTPAWKEGWDAGNETYNGCYAIKNGDKIFVNTGIITFVGADTPKTKPYRGGQGVSEENFQKEVAKYRKQHELLIHRERGAHGVLKRIMISIPNWKPIKGASAYTDEWLKEKFPKKYDAGWRMHPKQGLIPPSSIKPTLPKPVACTSCGAKKFHFVATGINKPTYHWECDKCGVLHKAR
jgi:hypothetical protein